MIVLQITNLAELKKAHDTFLKRNEEAIGWAMDEGKTYAKRMVDTYPGFKRRTGNLQQSTKYRVVKLRNGKLLTISNDQKYAGAMDQGARPHIIRAKNAPFLVFFWEKKNRWVRTKKVRHPGNRPYNTFLRSTTVAHRVIGMRLRSQMAALARKF